MPNLKLFLSIILWLAFSGINHVNATLEWKVTADTSGLVTVVVSGDPNGCDGAFGPIDSSSPDFKKLLKYGMSCQGIVKLDQSVEGAESRGAFPNPSTFTIGKEAFPGPVNGTLPICIIALYIGGCDGELSLSDRGYSMNGTTLLDSPLVHQVDER